MPLRSGHREQDEIYMRIALELAEKGMGFVNPNPMVGAVLVKGGRIISTGYHARLGAPHAEAIAVRKAGRDARGASLYVNLEPCSHIGRTPPCTEAIIAGGIKKVFCAIRDPNPLNNGRGIEMLKRHNIQVRTGLLAARATELNKVFIKYITRKMPYVTLKVAESIDGKIATRTGDSRWISNEESRRQVHLIRSQVDAVLVGINTILIDNPLLSSRRGHNPVKVIIDPRLKVPERARIFSKSSPGLNVIAISKNILGEKEKVKKAMWLSKKGVLIISCPEAKGRIDLKALLRELAELEIAHLLVEGGGDTIAGFIESNLADEAMFFIAPKIIGGRDVVTSVEGEGVLKVKDARPIRDPKIEIFGDNILIKGKVC